MLPMNEDFDQFLARRVLPMNQILDQFMTAQQLQHLLKVHMHIRTILLVLSHREILWKQSSADADDGFVDVHRIVSNKQVLLKSDGHLLEPKQNHHRMNVLNNIAFFWIGPDITIPALLVRSIRLAFGPRFNVIQLSDRSTPKVDGVTSHKQLKLSPHIMVARLEAYAALSIKAPTLFLDADMLVLRPFDLPPLTEHQVGVTIRGERDTLRFSEEECASEPRFIGKNTAQVMPYLYSFVYVRSPVLFVRQLNALRKLPKRFHLWYGDQMTLKSELDAPGRFVIQPINIDIYNRTVGSRLEFEEIRGAPEAVCVAHFKGKESKRAMLESLSLLKSS